MTKKALFIATLAVCGFLVPSISSASALTPAQTNAIVALLEAFGVAPATVAHVAQILGAASALPADPAASSTPPAAHVPVSGSLYSASNVGYDLSFNTVAYPTIPFGFGVVGVTRGRAFTLNSRISSEYSWARFGTNRPTLYMNLNAPYGSTVAGHDDTPKSCAASQATSTEPTACQGYDYGYNAAADAYAYAASKGVSSPLWWLDIEEANSWSPDVSVNDSAIQGALDYLNGQNVRVGIYSTPRMWSDIAGAGFVPAQALGGNAVSTPTWFPIGIANQVGALNACASGTSFIPGSPVWLIQYEAGSTAVDQNIAC